MLKKRIIPAAVFFLICRVLSAQMAVVVSPLDAGRVYPNPWRADLHQNAMITFDSLPVGSTIKLFTLSAHLVRTLPVDSTGMAKWDRKNSSGDPVASGIYLYLISDSQGHETKGKLAIIQ